MVLFQGDVDYAKDHGVVKLGREVTCNVFSNLYCSHVASQTVDTILLTGICLNSSLISRVADCIVKGRRFAESWPANHQGLKIL